MTKARNFSVIWKNANRIEFYQNGIWNGRAYTTPTLLEVYDPKTLSGRKLPEIYASFRHFEKTGELP